MVGATWEIRQGDCVEEMRELADASVDAVVCDPPYGLSREPDIAEVLQHWLAGDDYEHRGGGFMGQSWDSFVPGPAVWREAFRVLKPGGHLLAFAGSRTVDLMAIAIRLGGFEIRDTVMWLYGSGFPKSLDVSKAVDKRRDDGDDKLRVTAWFAEVAERNGVSRADVDAHMGTSDMAGWWLSRLRHRCAIPTLEQVPRLLEVLGVDVSEVPDELRDLLIDLNGMKGQPGEAWFRREVVGQQTKARSEAGSSALPTMGAATEYRTWDLTASATTEAEQWEGWGTALKPAHEPIVVARKQLAGTVAANVLEHGTGGLNINGCRIAAEGGSPSQARREQARRSGKAPSRPGEQGATITNRISPERYMEARAGEAAGRWPANVVLDPEAAAMLDEQTGELKSGFMAAGTERDGLGYRGGLGSRVRHDTHGDSGGASRFFYCAKASRAERNAGLVGFEERMPDNAVDRAAQRDGQEGAAGRGSLSKPRANVHPTVKPIELMRWLVRLVTPPGGLVLDPFTGSGTTGCAAVLEGFEFVGLEREPEYVEIAKARIGYWADPVKAKVALAQAERERQRVEADESGAEVQLNLESMLAEEAA